jgi:hypothetical protein
MKRPRPDSTDAYLAVVLLIGAFLVLLQALPLWAAIQDLLD